MAVTIGRVQADPDAQEGHGEGPDIKFAWEYLENILWKHEIMLRRPGWYQPPHLACSQIWAEEKLFCLKWLPSTRSETTELEGH